MTQHKPTARSGALGAAGASGSARSQQARADASTATPEDAATDRPLRADAQRNRDKLMAVARSAFAASGDAVALESIAREAGVGIGTLYRHFPTRESLVEAVYAAEVDEVTSNIDALLDQHGPDAALRAWLARYAQFFQTKRSMLQTLRIGWASGRIATPSTRQRVTAAIGSILDAGKRDGSFRTDIAADDVTSLVVGVLASSMADGSAAAEHNERLLGYVVDALRSEPVRP